MQEASMEITHFAMDERDRSKGDEKLYVKFFVQPLQNRTKSIEAGRPIFEEKTFIQIMVPGDKDNIVTREIRENDKRRFPKQWAAYENDRSELIEGTPLEQWPHLSVAQVEELKYFNIRTVEQLAGVSDSASQNFMGIQVLKARAQEFLEASKENVSLASLQEELKDRDAKIAAQDLAISQMAEDMAKLRASLDKSVEEELPNSLTIPEEDGDGEVSDS